MSKNLEKEIEALKKENRLLDSKIIELYTLYNMSKKLSLAMKLEEIFSGTMEVISGSLDIDDFCIMLLDKKTQSLHISACYGDIDLSGTSFSVGEGVTGMVVKTGERRLISDVSQCEDFLFYKGKKKNIGSFLCVPLKGRDGEVLGAFNVHKHEAHSFTGVDVDFFAEVADHIAAAVYKALSLRRMEELSNRDPLTGLFNRRYFFDHFEKEVERLKRYNHHSSLILLDVDYFKNFNDVNGHLLGDEALKAVAKVLINNTRDADVIARFGGEEFIVILPETEKEKAMAAAEKIRQAIEDEKVAGEENQPGGKLTATIGVSSMPDDAIFASEIVDCADKALYLGKTKGRNIVVAYTEK
ncbi:MAG: GGDEF domain-containing protein [Proteobacteria bacterium]|nr:GGDEF domain-containing protein [Pseudomonadota bacterium]